MNIDTVNWQISFVVPKNDYLKIKHFFDETTLAFSAFELEEDKDWKLDLVVDEQPDLEAFQMGLRSEGVSHIRDLNSKPIGDIDWLEATHKAFPAFEWEDYYLFGSHIRKETCPQRLIPLQIGAATAFGSGEHATTKGCLSLLNQAIKNNLVSKDTSILDMGCGSGILSIAAAKKLTPKNMIFGIDIDQKSVEVAHENATINKVENQVTYMHGNGFQTSEIKEKKFGLIFANILANPLIEMAQPMEKASTNIIILSGLLKTQEAQVVKAYHDIGFEVIDTCPIKEWQSLLLQKKA